MKRSINTFTLHELMNVFGSTVLPNDTKNFLLNGTFECDFHTDLNWQLSEKESNS